MQDDGRNQYQGLRSDLSTQHATSTDSSSCQLLASGGAASQCSDTAGHGLGAVQGLDAVLNKAADDAAITAADAGSSSSSNNNADSLAAAAALPDHDADNAAISVEFEDGPAAADGTAAEELQPLPLAAAQQHAASAEEGAVAPHDLLAAFSLLSADDDAAAVDPAAQQQEAPSTEPSLSSSSSSAHGAAGELQASEEDASAEPQEQDAAADAPSSQPQEGAAAEASTGASTELLDECEAAAAEQAVQDEQQQQEEEAAGAGGHLSTPDDAEDSAALLPAAGATPSDGTDSEGLSSSSSSLRLPMQDADAVSPALPAGAHVSRVSALRSLRAGNVTGMLEALSSAVLGRLPLGGRGYLAGTAADQQQLLCPAGQHSLSPHGSEPGAGGADAQGAVLRLQQQLQDVQQQLANTTDALSAFPPGAVLTPQMMADVYTRLGGACLVELA